MWQFFDNKILYIGGEGNGFDWNPIYPVFENTGREIITVSRPLGGWKGYDYWVQLFPLQEEIELLKNAIENAKNNTSYRAHMRGISCAESVEILRDYYRELGYEDTLDKSYSLPDTVQITASISLRHALWCEKDKSFLSKKDQQGNRYGMVAPPIRSSHDLRILQQALRMNIILGVEVYPGDDTYINLLVEKEILSPFSVSQMIGFRWGKYGFTNL